MAKKDEEDCTPSILVQPQVINMRDQCDLDTVSRHETSLRKMVPMSSDAFMNKGCTTASFRVSDTICHSYKPCFYHLLGGIHQPKK